MTESAPEAFVARFSIPKLLGWAAASGGMATASLLMARGDSGALGLVLGTLGVLLFGSIAAVHARRLFDRRAQVIIDSDGLYVRSHGEKRIALRSIQTMRTDAITHEMAKLSLYLFKPAKHPIETRHRRFIYRLNGSGAREFFGDVWIWSTHLDQPIDVIMRAIWAHRPMTEFEKQVAALEDAALGD